MARYFLLFILIAMNFLSIVQNKIDRLNYVSRTNAEPLYKVISFGDKIDFGNIHASVRGAITNSKDGIDEILNGKQIKNYPFQQTAEYEVRFSESKKYDQGCNDALFAEKMITKVNLLKLSFDFSKIKFSQMIQRGKSYDNLIVIIPASITTQNNSILKFTAPGLSSAGIGLNG